jgi:hypothetical protein
MDIPFDLFFDFSILNLRNIYSCLQTRPGMGLFLILWMLYHFSINISLKVKVHKSRLYCIHFTAVLKLNWPLFFSGKGIFSEKKLNTGIDIFEIPVLYRPRYCIFNTELETLVSAPSVSTFEHSPRLHLLRLWRPTMFNDLYIFLLNVNKKISKNYLKRIKSKLLFI